MDGYRINDEDGGGIHENNRDVKARSIFMQLPPLPFCCQTLVATI